MLCCIRFVPFSHGDAPCRIHRGLRKADEDLFCRRRVGHNAYQQEGGAEQHKACARYDRHIFHILFLLFTLRSDNESASFYRGSKASHDGLKFVKHFRRAFCSTSIKEELTSAKDWPLAAVAHYYRSRIRSYRSHLTNLRYFVCLYIAHRVAGSHKLLAMQMGSFHN